MANDVRIRFKSFLPGAGFDSSGGAKQGKTRVVGTITVTSYTGGSGEPLSARDLGLSTIDAISLRVREQIGGEVANNVDLREVAYSLSAARFYVFTSDTAGARTGLASAGTETLEFDVFGDSASDVELT